MKYLFLFSLLLFSAGCRKHASKKMVARVDKKQTPGIQISPNFEFPTPLLVWSSDVQPNPELGSPAVFYPPHQDDETLGMGASISEHVRAGKPVYVVLFTNGESAALGILNGKEKCDYHKVFHDFKLNHAEFRHARNKEFIAACKVLGVHRIYIANNGLGFKENMPTEQLTRRFRETILYFEKNFPGSDHKLINGICDHTPHNTRNSAHEAGAVAIKKLYDEGIVTYVRLYRVYTYYSAKKYRVAGWIKPVHPADKLRRKKACDEYGLFYPEIGRYAIGYEHSVYPLFSASYSSNFEYIDFPETTCE
jgi:hypothetical protein